MSRDSGDLVLYGACAAVVSLGGGLVAGSYGFDLAAVAIAVPALLYVAAAVVGGLRGLRYAISEYIKIRRSAAAPEVIEQ